MKFSIIVVCLNPGDKLFETIETIQSQTYKNYEVVVKDGMSTDGSVDKLPAEERIRVFKEKDKSIYDAMNQAVKYATGDYYFFLNCGDLFYSDTVLEEVAGFIEEKKKQGEKCDIVYGNTYEQKTGTVVTSTPKINGFSCYRNVPCHQTCFYASDMFKERAYLPEYRVRGDYEHFLYCFYKLKASISSMPIVISYYEGGGFSESKANRKRSKREHKEIVRIYMTFMERFRYKTILLLTLAPLRKKIAESKSMSGVYNKLKSYLYHR
ncbi:MAG: glycosyltransferase [Lachnospiraceae bacterium]|nr:glycosyltransferase [Lachnospiraceae bacterium]